MWQLGVVWHTGEVLTCSLVGPRFNSWQGQEILWCLFCSELGWHTTPDLPNVPHFEGQSLILIIKKSWNLGCPSFCHFAYCVLLCMPFWCPSFQSWMSHIVGFRGWQVCYSGFEADWLVLEHFPFTNAASQWLYVNLVCWFHTRLGRFSLGTPVSSYI